MKVLYAITACILVSGLDGAKPKNAAEEDQQSEFVKVDVNGKTVVIDSSYLPNYRERVVTEPSTTELWRNLFVSGSNLVQIYGNEDCSDVGGKTVSVSLDYGEKKCTYCWDSCSESFDDGSSVRLNIKSIRIPDGVVAVTFKTCVGTYGFPEANYNTVLEPGCSNVEDTNHLVFAQIVGDGTYEVLGKPAYEDGDFDGGLGVGHWNYGQEGIEDAQGTSWYQYIFDLLPLDEPKRIKLQVGTGGTWLVPTQKTWNKGDPCLCYPKDWPATDGGRCGKEDLTECKNGCCGTDGCEHLFQTMEGGSGYWGGKLPTNAVKWTIGSVGGCYFYWSNSPLEVANSQELLCDEMGVIAVSNHLLYPPDGIGFLNEGMLGHAWINSPIGKVDNNDNRRFLTLILDTDNFKGPVAYMLPEYYGKQSKWEYPEGTYHPQHTFGDSGITTGGGAFEWSSVPVVGFQESSQRKVRIPNMQFSFNDEEGGNPKTVLMSGAKSYESLDDFYTPLDKVMHETEGTPPPESDFLKLDSGTIHQCNPDKYLDLRVDFEGKPLSLGAHLTHREEDDGMCSSVVHWDASSKNLNCNSSLCRMKDSYKITEDVVRKESGNWIYETGKLEGLNNTPQRLSGDVFPTQTMKLNFDRKIPHNLCGGEPVFGNKLFCRQTSTTDWIGWRWFKFTEQPSLQRLNLTKKEKDFLQESIETLHKYMEPNAPLNSWLKTPTSSRSLVTVDPKLLITPPEGMEYGYVPIIVYQELAKPEECSEDGPAPVPSVKPSTTPDTPQSVDCDSFEEQEDCKKELEVCKWVKKSSFCKFKRCFKLEEQIVCDRSKMCYWNESKSKCFININEDDPTPAPSPNSEALFWIGLTRFNLKGEEKARTKPCSWFEGKKKWKIDKFCAMTEGFKKAKPAQEVCRICTGS